MKTHNRPIDEIFAEAVEIESPEKREKYLAVACGDDAALQQKVERLITVHFAAGRLLESPAPLEIATDARRLESLVMGLSPAGTLGDFRLIRQIGRGGMGVVYEAEQISLERRVALKVLPFAAVLDPRQLKRFETEAKAAAGLHHPNIVPVIQVGADRAVHFYAMQYIEGQDISELIQQLRAIAELDQLDLPETADADFTLASDLASGRFQPLDQTRCLPPAELNAESAESLSSPKESNSAVETYPWAEMATKESVRRPAYSRTIAGLGVQAAEALEYAHQHGILHRDIKPSNLMLDAEGKLWITDFGLARVNGNDGLTMTGDVMGTLRYMSPEQALGRNEQVDERSDVYSLGVTLYEMLALQPIHGSADRSELLHKLIHEQPIPLRQLNKSIPADLETIVHKAMSKEPVDRYASARQFADDLRRFLNHEPIQATRPMIATRFVKWSQRHRTLAALLFAAAFIGGTVAAGIMVVVKDRHGKELVRASVPPGGQIQFEDPNDDDPIPDQSKGDVPPPLNGLLPEPPALPGIGRWQIESRYPHSTRHGHVAWSPDGRHIAMTDGKMLRVYEVPSFELTKMFFGHAADITNVDWSPNGKLIASASEDQTVRIWDFETGTPNMKLFGNACEVRCVKWNPDGKRLVSGNVAGNLRMWSLDGKLLKRWQGHPNSPVNDIAWSPDGKTLASTGADGKIALSSDQGEWQSAFDTKKGAIRTVDWSPDGTQLLTTNPERGEVCLWKRAGTPGPVFAGHTAGPMCAAWSPDGQRVASGANDGRLRIWDVATGAKTVSEIGRKEVKIHCVAWHPGGESVSTFSRDGLQIWDANGIAIAQLPRCLRTRDARLSPDGQKLAVNVGASNEFYMLLCNADGTQPQFLDQIHEYPVDFDWTPDSQSFVVGGWRFHASAPILRLCGRDGSAGKVLIDSPDFDVPRLSMSPRGNQLALVIDASELYVRKNSLLRIWNLDGTPGPICAGSEDVYALRPPAWNPQGNKIAACSLAKGVLKIWSTDDGQLEQTLIVAGGVDVVWKSDGTQIAVVLPDLVQVWNMEGRQIAALKTADVGAPPYEWATVANLSFSDNYSPGPAASVRHHNPRTGRLDWILTLTGNKHFVRFAADGHILDGDPLIVDREFVCILEQPNGAFQIIRPSEFRHRF